MLESSPGVLLVELRILRRRTATIVADVDEVGRWESVTADFTLPY